jgi:predicted nucleotidyltransferase
MPGELAYLVGHWKLLSELIRAFRTEPNVRLAVLYGSRARGSERVESDLDILVDFRDDTAASTASLARRIEEQLEVPVDIARLSRVRKEAPFLLLQAVNEGRVLIDRERAWAALRAERETIARGARRQTARGREDAADSIAQLLEEL